MDIFKKNKTPHSSYSHVNGDYNGREKEFLNYVQEKRREKRNGVGGSNGLSTSELNINIWPFSSRSAGNDVAKPRAAASRKVSSDPCSRSNSAGESKSRKWPPSSPSRAGVHVGRSSPVWQIRRAGNGRSSEAVLKNAQKSCRNDCRRKITAAGSPKTSVLSFNVPMCIGYSNHLSCRSDDKSGVGIGYNIQSSSPRKY